MERRPGALDVRKAAALIYPERDAKGRVTWVVDAMPDVLASGFESSLHAIAFARYWCPVFIVYEAKPKGNAA